MSIAPTVLDANCVPVKMYSLVSFICTLHMVKNKVIEVAVIKVIMELWRCPFYPNNFSELESYLQLIKKYDKMVMQDSSRRNDPV